MTLRGYIVFKHHSTGFTMRDGEARAFRCGDKGIADLITCSPIGQFTAIEVKMPGKQPSQDQIEFIKSFIKKRGIAFVAHSLEDAIEGLPC